MFRFFLLFIISTNILYASDKVEIFASDIYTQDDILYAQGEVNVVYKDYYISANRAKYNKLSGDLELFENIRITQGTNYKILGEYAKINIKNKQKEFKPFYMLEKKSKVWISAKKAKNIDEEVSVSSGMVSGCNPNNPLWKIEFSSSDYNEQTKWLNTYNNRLYIYDIPIFYTPYFGYSLDRKRRTGLLYPTFGLSSDEGLYIEQPIYIAEQNWWDLEIKPQIRSRRGNGIYSELRFVDSKTSRGSLTLGYFKEKDSYIKEYNLEREKKLNKEHMGFDFKYNNSDFLNLWFGTNYKGQSALYADLHNMTDVDYINLSTNDTSTNSTSQQTLSRINMFYNNEDNYIGSYLKYYQYLNIEDNSDTLQQLPTIHLHHYLETLFDKHFLYNLDVKSTNIQRKKGVGVIQSDFNVPLTLQTTIFDEYINLSYKTIFYGQLSHFTGLEDINNTDYYSDGYDVENYSVLQARMSLTKGYTDFTHVINFGTYYSMAGKNKKNGYYEDNDEFCSKNENADDPRCDFYNVSSTVNDFKVEFSQYIYDSSGSEKLYHKLSQNIVYKDSTNSRNDKEFGELENELSYKISDSLNFYNNTFYNHDEKDFSKVYNQITYKGYGINSSISFKYENKFHKDGETYTSEPFAKYLTSSLAYKYDEHYSYKLVYNYDYQINQKKNLEVGFLYKKRCWDFGLKYVENNRPTQYDSIYDRYVYFTILLKPFMQQRGTDNFSYKLPETYKGK